jgi:malonate-semialdehyde dehydrogenase (acetylating)/methylmalonate-semialdehyde dehydrogenase
VYETAAKAGKRVQALAQAKNHALVLPDCALERTARAIVNAAFGCGGQRCMALPVVVVHNAIADSLVELVLRYAGEIQMGDANDPETQLGPLVTATHKQRVLQYIEKGEREDARLLLDGRAYTNMPDHLSQGFYLGPTLFDHVTNEMVIGREEIFGPVLCFKRVKGFKEGVEVINASEFGNGAAIFTQSGYHAREFSRQVQAGMVGVNVAIPVPIGYFSFTGWKKSFFGDLHSHGKDGVLFYTEKKSVTYRWFDEESSRTTRVGTWD